MKPSNFFLFLHKTYFPWEAVTVPRLLMSQSAIITRVIKQLEDSDLVNTKKKTFGLHNCVIPHIHTGRNRQKVPIYCDMTHESILCYWYIYNTISVGTIVRPEYSTWRFSFTILTYYSSALIINKNFHILSSFIIIINIKDWTLWSVPSPELRLIAPTLLRSSNCSPSLWSLVVWFQRDSVLWYSSQVWKQVLMWTKWDPIEYYFYCTIILFLIGLTMAVYSRNM